MLNIIKKGRMPLNYIGEIISVPYMFFLPKISKECPHLESLI